MIQIKKYHVYQDVEARNDNIDDVLFNSLMGRFC